MSAHEPAHSSAPTAAGTTRPTLSVIVPAYNAEPYLDAALAGVAAQTVQPDEVVVIDDASTDDTLAIAKKWSAVLPINLVEIRENGGLGAARREGIARSSGQRISLLDADDYWLPDHLEVMLAWHDRHGGIVTPNHHRWVPATKLGTVPVLSVQPIPPPERQPLAILEANFLSYGCVFDRAAYDAAGGFRDLRSSEDWDMWIRMIRNAGQRVVRPTVATLIYRKRPDSLSATNATIATNIRIFEELVPTLTGEDRAIAARTLRRYKARDELLAGFRTAADGDVWGARKLWLRAAVRDRSLRIGPGIKGSSSVRALAAAVAPNRMARTRADLLSDTERLVKW